MSLDSQKDGEDWITFNINKIRPLSTRKAYALQRELDIIGLANFLLSENSRKLQKNGWKFFTVLKGNENFDIQKYQSENFQVFDLNNKYSDKIVFMRD